MSKFTIEMLPAKHGDALWVEYGLEGGKTRRMIVDAGPIASYPEVQARVDKLDEADRRVELLVISHVDTDHIEGVIGLMVPERARWGINPREIWFNGYHHMREQEDLGGKQGEYLSALLHQRAPGEWNKWFGGKAVVIRNESELPRVPLLDGMKLTLLSPDQDKLERMAKQWETDIAAWKTDPGDLDAAWDKLAKEKRYLQGEELTLGSEDLDEKLRKQLMKGKDSSEANGSSIAFLAQFEGKSCLFLADAHSDRILKSLRLLASPDDPLRVDAVKVSHHGSKNNIRPELFDLVVAKHWLISTNGDVHGHPDEAAIEGIIQGAKGKPKLWFNYENDFTRKYASHPLHGVNFTTRYPKAGQEGIVISL